MIGKKASENGQLEARTPDFSGAEPAADLPGSAADLPGSPPAAPGSAADAWAMPDDQALRQAMAELAGAAEPGDAPGLFDDDCDLVAGAAKQAAAGRRARGRPAGALNRRNDKLFDAMEAAGYGNAAVDMIKLAAADPRVLASAMAGPDAGPPSFDRVLEVMRLQMRAREALLPYMLAKKAVDLNVNTKAVHLFLAGRMSPDMEAAAQGFDLTGGLNENNDLAVRQTDNVPHDDG